MRRNGQPFDEDAGELFPSYDPPPAPRPPCPGAIDLGEDDTGVRHYLGCDLGEHGEDTLHHATDVMPVVFGPIGGFETTVDVTWPHVPAPPA